MSYTKNLELENASTEVGHPWQGFGVSLAISIFWPNYFQFWHPPCMSIRGWKKPKILRAIWAPSIKGPQIYFRAIFGFSNIFYTSDSENEPLFLRAILVLGLGVLWVLAKFWGQFAWGTALFWPLVSIKTTKSQVALKEFGRYGPVMTDSSRLQQHHTTSDDPGQGCKAHEGGIRP